MPLDLQILCLGAAATIDSALLLGLLERRNLRIVAMPVVALVTGIWLFHCGEFSNLLLAEAVGDWAESARFAAMSVMSAGLLLMPCSLLHGVIRTWRTGLNYEVPRNWRYASVYIPLLILPVAIQQLASKPGQPFLARLILFVTPYTFATCAVLILAICTFMRQVRSGESRELRRFLELLVLLLVGLTGLLGLLWWQGALVSSLSDSPLLLLVIMTPLGPTLLFSYFVIRYRFMQLVLERTFVYGAFLAAILLFHQLVVQDATERLQDRFRIDFSIIEGVFVVLLVVLYAPIRQRVKEALRYLLGRDVTDLRARTRRLAVEMWQHIHHEPQLLTDWFVSAVRQSFNVRRAAVWLFDAKGPVIVRSGDVGSFSEEEAMRLHGLLKSHAFVSLDGGGVSDVQTIDLLQRMQASLAVRIDHAGISGLLVLGRRSRAREFVEEETNAVLLLVELLGVTLHNHHLQVQQLQAERVAAQNEKLATLGMLASCLTHEIKNPLSSIKTIASVMAEQFGDDHPQAEDVRLILSEVQRLSTTTGQFLRFARPALSGNGPADIGLVIESAIQVLASLAKDKGVQIESVCEPNLPDVAADENTVRSIVFNLLLNSIEAAGHGGHVHVDACRNGCFVVTTVRDDGPGIAQEIHDQLFAPFVTSKPSGTGLGLYIVRRNVEQLGGKITCDSKPGEATCFTVKLPFV